MQHASFVMKVDVLGVESLLLHEGEQLATHLNNKNKFYWKFEI